MVKRLATLPLVHHPGEKWSYRVNMDVLGYMIEKFSGKTLDKFLSEKIFTPLNMTDTYFYLPEEKVKRLVTLYGEDATGQLKKITGEAKSGPSTYGDYATFAANKTYFAGGGGLISTPMDYYKFLQMLLSNGVYNNKRILSRKTVELLTSEQTGNLFNGWSGYGSGFGFAISRGPELTGNVGSKGEYRWLGFFDTHYWVDPKENLIGILMMQHQPANNDLNAKFKNLAYQAIND